MNTFLNNVKESRDRIESRKSSRFKRKRESNWNSLLRSYKQDCTVCSGKRWFTNARFFSLLLKVAIA